MGKKINSYTIIGETRHPKTRKRQFIFRCECGEIRIKAPTVVMTGAIKSCLCKNSERKTNLIHGMRDTRIYRIWLGMKNRCNNKNCKCYHLYGGRGITYDKKRGTFQGFQEDMEEGYSDELTLDREDTNGNYCKSNCRWATREEQANNKNNNHIIEYNGEKDTLANMCRKYNMGYLLVLKRLIRGRTIKKSFNTPPQKRNR